MNFTFALAFRHERSPNGLEIWQMINDGPAILKPTVVNSFEPLRKVRDVNVEVVCRANFIWRNGRKCLGMFEPSGWEGKSTLAILLKYKSSDHSRLINEVHGFLKSNFDYRLLYGVTPSYELMDKNLEISQLANCGAIPPDEAVISRNRELFEIYEEYA